MHMHVSNYIYNVSVAVLAQTISASCTQALAQPEARDLVRTSPTSLMSSARHAIAVGEADPTQQVIGFALCGKSNMHSIAKVA